MPGQVAVKLGFHHFIVDIREEFGDYVIDNFVDEYMAGRTPNPCVLCNTHIKWNSLLRRADMLDCEFIATGTTASSTNWMAANTSPAPKTGRKTKVMCCGASARSACNRTRMPLGPFTKPEVRQWPPNAAGTNSAKKPRVTKSALCPTTTTGASCAAALMGWTSRWRAAILWTRQGKVLGKHEGYPFYTVGQRKGLGIALGEPMFVTEIRPETNTVVLGREDDLIRNGMMVGKVNLMKYKRSCRKQASKRDQNPLPRRRHAEHPEPSGQRRGSQFPRQCERHCARTKRRVF
jgi:tRNA-specific 2-thiouridylase